MNGNSSSQTMQYQDDGDIIDPDDPLLIAQTLTYVTDNGSVVMSYSSAPFTTCKFKFEHKCYIFKSIDRLLHSMMLFCLEDCISMKKLTDTFFDPFETIISV